MFKVYTESFLDPRYYDLFSLNHTSVNTRQEKLIYREFQYRTDRFYDSPLCYLTRLLNIYPVKQQSCLTRICDSKPRLRGRLAKKC